ncbi:dual specificity protein phosphatase 13-like isoform X1 [Arapaima gigas]
MGKQPPNIQFALAVHTSQGWREKQDFGFREGGRQSARQFRRFCAVLPTEFHRMEQEESASSLKECEYQTPPTSDLLHLLLKNRHPTGPLNEVWPRVYIGNASTAQDKDALLSLGITHVVNAAHGPHHINTGAEFYTGTGISYYGIEAPDHQDFNLTPYFSPTAKFIQSALSHKGKVFVHCARGISRSATLVLAFLIICEKLTLVEAIKAVRQHRNVLPNVGFLNQLRDLDKTLYAGRRTEQERDVQR